MDLDINPKFNENAAAVYKTQWKAYYKRGFGSPTVVYGETVEEAMNNALAYYRKNTWQVDMRPAEKIVDHVEFIG